MNIAPSDPQRQWVSDKYYWLDFLNDSSKVFDSLDDLLEFFKINFSRVCKKVLMGIGLYLRKDDEGLLHNRVYTTEFDRTTKFQYKVNTTQRNGAIVIKEKTIKLGDLFELASLNGGINIYSEIVCHPLNTPPHALNIWTPLKADVVRPCNFSKVNPLLEYIKGILCDNNDEMYKYILTWIRQVCITPQTKTRKVLVFQGIQGSGKNAFTDWMTEHLFGEIHATNMQMGSAIAKFNSVLFNKVFITIDEPFTTNPKRRQSVFGTLKKQIKSETLDIEYKREEPFETPNLLNFIFTTSHKTIIKTDVGNTCHVLFLCLL